MISLSSVALHYFQGFNVFYSSSALTSLVKAFHCSSLLVGWINHLLLKWVSSSFSFKGNEQNETITKWVKRNSPRLYHVLVWLGCLIHVFLAHSIHLVIRWENISWIVSENSAKRCFCWSAVWYLCQSPLNTLLLCTAPHGEKLEMKNLSSTTHVAGIMHIFGLLFCQWTFIFS